MIHPASVRRLEVYFRGVAVPAEFASNQSCGVLAVWTAPRRRNCTEAAHLCVALRGSSCVRMPFTEDTPTPPRRLTNHWP